MTFWDYSNFVSWDHCIEANRLCNLQYCPETMNCCVTNCVGSPTILSIILMFSVMGLIGFILLIFELFLKRGDSK